MSIESQHDEFIAVARLCRAHNALPAVVAEGYSEARHEYENALAALLDALKNNGRLESAQIVEIVEDDNNNKYTVTSKETVSWAGNSGTVNKQLYGEFVDNIFEELTRAENKHPNWPCNIVEAAAIVCEEAGELIRAALQFSQEGKPIANCDKEAIQTAAMCLRFLGRQ